MVGLLLKGERAREGQARGKTQQLPVARRDDDCLLLRRDSGCLPLEGAATVCCSMWRQLSATLWSSDLRNRVSHGLEKKHKHKEGKE